MNQPLVTIRCIVYNHEPFLRQCLDGFVMQKTNFKFEVWVHDDASTDGSPAIIKEYAEKYPDIIKPYFEKENQYSKHYDNFQKITNSPQFIRGKYVALCEGDDYWIDPLKLQKQVDYLEEHPNCTMVCNRVHLFSEKQNKIIGEDFCYNHDCIVKTKDVIYRGGLFIPTCSIVYRKSVKDNYPDYCRNCVVGDYPLQIMAAMKGDIFYFNKIMSVYRTENMNSWMSKQKWGTIDDKRIKVIKSRINMLSGFSKDFPQHIKLFKNKIADEIRRNLPLFYTHPDEHKKFINLFSYEISQINFMWKIDYKLRSTKIPLLNRYYYKSKFLFSHYNKKRLLYN